VYIFVLGRKERDRERERERAKIKLAFSPFFLSVRCHVEFI
jgi:hypothetical protein